MPRARTPQRYQIQGYGSAQPTQVVTAGDGATTLVNNDTSNTVYFDNNSGVNPTRSTTPFLPPQASTSVDGKEDIYVICPAGETADFLAFPGVVPWNNPVGVQIALNALGLAKDSSVQAVKTTLGVPAQTTDVINTLPTNLGGGKKLSDINTTLGIPAQTADVITTLPNNIAATGVPLLSNSQVLANPGTQTFTSGQIRIPVNNVTIDQVSYEISIALQAAATGETTPFMLVTLSWNDSTSGQTVAQETWVLGGCTGTVNQNLYSGVGRCKGNQLKVTWKWLGAATSGSCQIVVTQTSRIYVRDDFRTIGSFNGLAGFTSANYDLDGGCVINTNPSIGGNSSATRSMPLYHGTVFVAAQPPENFTVSIQNAAQSTANGGFPASEIWAGSANAGANLNSMVVLPRSNCTITLGNSSVTLATFPLQIIVAEQEL